MIITEKQLRAIVRECIVRTINEQELNEGKLGRALGTMALGGALMFGGANTHPADAQLNLKNSVRSNPRVIATYYNTNLEELDGAFFIRFQKEGVTITLGNDVNRSLQTLYDLLGLIDDKAKNVEVRDSNNGDYTISYGMIGPDHGLYIEQRGRGQQAFLYKNHLDKMINTMRDSSIFDDKANGYDDYFDDWAGKEKTRARNAAKGRYNTKGQTRTP